MAIFYFRVEFRVFEKRENTHKAAEEEFVGIFGVCTRERYITREISNNDRFILALKEREREREKELLLLKHGWWSQ
jgi:hypothetical protein|tara:strand:- start:402 stop:629 length:228 start_codon:yes stop_codon:yes gene_type:complete